MSRPLWGPKSSAKPPQPASLGRLSWNEITALLVLWGFGGSTFLKHRLSITIFTSTMSNVAHFCQVVVLWLQTTDYMSKLSHPLLCGPKLLGPKLPEPKLAQPKVGPIQNCPSPKLSLLLWLCQFVRCPFWQYFFSRLISAPFLVSYRPDNTSAYLQDVWLPSCNLKLRLRGLFYIRIIKFIVGTTMGQANYGWDNIRPGQLWFCPSMCGPTLVRATLVRTTMGGTTLSWYPNYIVVIVQLYTTTTKQSFHLFTTEWPKFFLLFFPVRRSTTPMSWTHYIADMF